MKIKILIFAFFVSLLSFQGWFGSDVKTQNAILQLGDTTEIFDVYGANNVILTVVDSSNLKVDTIHVQFQGGDTTSTVEFYWSIISLHDLAQTTTTTNVASAIPGDGVTKSYQLVSPDAKGYPFRRVRVVRSNTAAYAPRTKINITWQ